MGDGRWSKFPVPAILRCSFFLLLVISSGLAQPHLGFDRNVYPGDENLSALHQKFAFMSYWLNNPPGAKSNSWVGKRATVNKAGFGFVLLFNGKTYAQLKDQEAEGIGSADGLEAVAAAKREGFPSGATIFLDQEEGGRLLDDQKAYIFAWVDAVNGGGYHAGVYCSGIPVTEAEGETIVTADDIRGDAGDRKIAYFVFNDRCPPSPGCVLKSAAPGGSGIDFADIWQFAQSPRRAEFTDACSQTYAADGNCYPEGMKIHVDLDTASSSDPSHGRNQ